MTARSVRDISHTRAIRHRGGVVLRFVTVLTLITTSHLTVHCLCCVSGHVLPKCHFSSSYFLHHRRSLSLMGLSCRLKVMSESTSVRPGLEAAEAGHRCGQGFRRWPNPPGPSQLSASESLTSHSATGSYPGLVTTHQPPEQSRHHQMSANCKKVSTERR